jgi:hypothetical protein
MRRPSRGSCTGGQASSSRGQRSKVGGEGASSPKPMSPSLLLPIPPFAWGSLRSPPPLLSILPLASKHHGKAGTSLLCSLRCRSRGIWRRRAQQASCPWGWRRVGSCAPRAVPELACHGATPDLAPRAAPKLVLHGLWLHRVVPDVGERRSRASKEQRRDVGERSEEGRGKNQ